MDQESKEHEIKKVKKIGKRGYFGIGIYYPKTEYNIGTLWRSAFIFDAAFIFTIGKRYKKQCSDTPNSINHIPLYNYQAFEDFYKNIPYGCQLVCIELYNKARMLKNFIHPERAIYLLGAEDYGIPKEILERHTVVQIDQHQQFSLNVAVAGSIVINHRYMQSKSDSL